MFYDYFSVFIDQRDQHFICGYIQLNKGLYTWRNFNVGDKKCVEIANNFYLVRQIRKRAGYLNTRVWYVEKVMDQRIRTQ